MALIVKIGANLSNFDKQMRKLTRDVNNVGGHLQEAGAKLTTGLTLPLAAVGAASLKVSDDFQKSQGSIQAQLGISENKAKQLSQTAENIWKQGFGENVQVASDTVAQLYNVMGNIPQKQLEALTKQALSLSKTFGVDINESITGTSTVMKNFGLSGQQAMDYVTYGLQHTTGQFRGDFMDALTELMPTFKGMGANAQQAFDMMVAAQNSGMENFDALSSLTQGFTDNLSSGSKDVASQFSALGGNAAATFEKFQNGGASAYDVMVATAQQLGSMDNQVRVNQIGASLFGDTWTEAGAKAVTSLGSVDGKVQGVTGSAAKATEAANQSFGDQFQATLRSVGDSLKPIGDVLSNLASSVFPAIQSAAANLSAAFQGLPQPAQNLIVIIGLVAAAIGPVLAVVGTMIIAFGQLSAACATLGISMMAAFWWVAIIIAALAGIVAVVVYWDQIKKYFASFWAYLQSLFSAALNYIKGLCMSIWNGIVSAAIAIWTGLTNFFSSMLSTLRALFSAVWNGIKSVSLSVWSAITGFLSSAWGAISGAAKSIWGGLVSYFQTVMNVYKTLFTVGWNLIKSFLSGLWNGIVAVGRAIWSGLVAYFQTTFSNLFTIFSTSWNAIKSVIISVWGGIKSGVSSAVNTVSSIVSGVWNGIRSVTSSVWNGIKNAIVSPISAAKDKVAGIVNAIKGFFSGMHLSLPRIKLPHFSIDGKFSLAPPSVPKLNIKWFKTGGVIKGTPGGSIIGAGDGGDEAVVPLSNKSRMLPFAQAIASMIGSGNDNDESTGPRLLRLENVVNLDGHELARVLQPVLDIVNADKITIDAIMSGGLP
ncbi:phage tail tape measure protein [Sporolactobacillus terrae]|uniref:phage tail tape measure protein n=1 Tax=Sporolactobacillus terrae TaxID=269673 RepID=UPI00048A90EC|nr:phage tail tape measure protein [Sporolactobacillus terrae]